MHNLIINMDLPNIIKEKNDQQESAHNLYGPDSPSSLSEQIGIQNKDLQIPTHFVDDLRITDEKTLEVLKLPFFSFSKMK